MLFYHNLRLAAIGVFFLLVFVALPQQSFCFQADIYRDGKIDLKDVILGLKISTGSAEWVNAGSDVNGNERIGIEEVIFINEYLAGYRANPAIIDYHTTYSGQATYYGATGEGACGFESSPENMMVAAVNHLQYNNSLPCGTFITVSGPGGEITVRIVDYCPTCDFGDIDLSLEAFTQLADPIIGIIPISWNHVQAETTDPLLYHFHDASHQWWTAVQIRNHRHPVASVEIYDASADSWVMLNRTEYNYFTAPVGMGLGPFTMRVTDYFDQQIVDHDIGFSPGASIPGSAQFPALPD